MRKREVIYYSGFSMEPPETVELLDNLEGRIVSDEKQKIIKYYLFGIKLKKLVFGIGVRNILKKKHDLTKF